MRLKSVQSIQKITKSMKMVSAAKFARAERTLKASRALGPASNGIYMYLHQTGAHPRHSPGSEVRSGSFSRREAGKRLQTIRFLTVMVVDFYCHFI